MNRLQVEEAVEDMLNDACIDFIQEQYDDCVNEIMESEPETITEEQFLDIVNKHINFKINGKWTD